MCGSSYKFGSRTLDSRSTPVWILEFGRNHMADIMDLYLQSATQKLIVSIPLTVRSCRYFLEKNSQIEKGTVKGEIINLKALGIGNGLTVCHLGILSGKVLLMVQIRTHFRNTLVTLTTLRQTHGTPGV